MSFLEFDAFNVQTTLTASATVTQPGLIAVTAAGGAVTLNLASSLCKRGVFLVIKNVANDTTGITLATEGSENIDGSSTKAVGGTAYLATRVYSDGTNWFTW